MFEYQGCSGHRFKALVCISALDIVTETFAGMEAVEPNTTLMPVLSKSKLR